MRNPGFLRVKSQNETEHPIICREIRALWIPREPSCLRESKGRESKLSKIREMGKSYTLIYCVIVVGGFRLAVVSNKL